VPLCLCVCQRYLQHAVHGILFILLTLVAIEAQAQQISLPRDNAVPGWTRFEKQRVFVRNDLYGYIDGGAELFLELGFKDLTVQKYHNGTAEITVEAYRMDRTDSALAIYLFKCGKETPIARIPVRNSGDQYQFTLLKGNYFLLINNFGGDKALQPIMIALANAILNNIPAGKPSVLLSNLPAENLIKGSELLIRGQYSLQSIITLGEGDILQLHGTIYGVAGDYKDTSGVTYTRIIIPYPDAKSAQSAYTNLLNHLDPYLKVVQKSGNSFTFKTIKGTVSKAELLGKILEIKL
jgi:Family of unknown function (DUF6599)